VPWQSGHYYIFSKFLIRAVVPYQSSGIFGLYACHEQIFIGESANLRQGLLRLHADMMRFGFDRPTGFTFELCLPSLRRKRLKQLLVEHEISYSDQPANIILYG
jgi:hypothetical protein